MSKIHDLESLREAVQRGARLKYLSFWGHSASRPDEIGKECLSQWYPARFEVEGVVFPTAEHYMMYRKALLFGDQSCAELILQAPNPGAAKALGRAVRG